MPIFLHCTSIFPESDCLLNLDDINYLDPYSSIKGEIPKLKSFFNDHSDWKSKSSYQQLSQLFSYYVPKYNAFVQELRTILQSKSKLETVPLKDVMPYMLIKNFSINGILLHLLCINAQSSYELIERNLSDLCKKVELFHIKYDSTDEDCIGLTNDRCDEVHYKIMKRKLSYTAVN